METLKYQEVSKEESLDFVETMLSDTSRLSGLIENILESSKADPKSIELQCQKVDLGKFLSEVVQDHKRQFEEKKCKVDLQLEASPLLTLDRNALQMVFNNLIGNALRYSPVGSALKIHLHRTGRFWDIDFADQGIGFDKKDMNCLLYTSPSPRDRTRSRMPSSA